MTINRDEWMKALEEAGVPQVHEGDQEALTVSEFMALFNLTASTARFRLEKLVDVGKARRTHKRVVNSYGRTQSQIAYRLL